MVTINKIDYYAKLIPLIQLDLDNMYSTHNYYNIEQIYYHLYKFGEYPWRELAFGSKATKFVLTGESDNFSMLYMHRIINTDKFKTYLNYLYGMKKSGIDYIDKIHDERSKSTTFLLLMMEYIPEDAYTRYCSLNNNVNKYLNEANKLIIFLHSKNIIHLNAVIFKLRILNTTLILVDYGLIHDLEYFNIAKTEINFVEDHKYLVAADLYSNISNNLLKIVQSPEVTKKLTHDFNYSVNNELIINYNIIYNNLPLIYQLAFKDNDIANERYITLLKKYKNYLITMSIWINQNRESYKPNMYFPNQLFKKLFSSIKN